MSTHYAETKIQTYSPVWVRELEMQVPWVRLAIQIPQVPRVRFAMQVPRVFKEEFTSVDLGNVQFTDGDGKTYRAYLTVEGGRLAVLLRRMSKLTVAGSRLGRLGLPNYSTKSLIQSF